MTKTAAWIIIALLLANFALAIGVSPIRKVVDFEPGKEVDLQLKIRNDAEKDLKALVYARGPLSEYIGITDSLVTITSKDKQKIARYRLSLPDKFEKPGTHKSDLVVMEYPSDFGTEQGATVSATASVVSELWVRVPFPGLYAEAQLYIDAKNTGEKVNFAIPVKNFGKANIAKATATIKILGATYEEIASIKTNTASIRSKEEAKLTASWLADVNPGKYHVIAEINYDNKKLILEKNFEVGNLVIDIKDITVKDFSLGEVAVFDINLESKWNEQIDDVYGEMTVLDKQGTEYTKFKTASIDIPAMGQGSLKAYWDTSEAKVGEYNLRILIHYAEKVTEKLIETEVNVDSIRTDLGPTAQVIAAEGSNRDTILTILVIILIAINIAWFTYFIRSKKR